MAAGTVVVTIVGNSTQLSSALNAAGRDLDGFAAKAQALSQKVTAVGKGMTMGLTLPIVGLGFLAFKAAEDFETAFAGVVKTVQGTEEQIAGLRQGIIEMARVLPASTTEIAAVAAAAGQLGVKTEDILAFTRVMIDLGETTNLSADEAATAIAQFANIIQLSGDEFDNFGSALVDLGNKSAATEADIVQMGLRIAGAGHQIGLTAPQILGIASALASVGIDAEAGGTAISRTLIEIATNVARGGDALQGWADVAGASVDEFANKFKTDAAGAVVDFIKGLQRIKADGGDVLTTLDALGITEVRQRDAILRLVGAGDLLADSIGIGNQAWQENNALQDEAAKRYDTTQAKLEIIRNKLNEVAVKIGEILIPYIEKAADFLARLAAKFQALDPDVQKAILAILALVAALGPLVFIVGVLMNPIAWFVLAILAIAAAAIYVWTQWDQIWGWIVDHPAYAIIIGILAAPLAAFVLIIGGLKLLWENWNEIWGWIKDKVDTVVNAVETVLRFLEDVFREVWDAIGPIVEAGVGVIIAAFGPLIEALHQMMSLLRRVRDAFNEVFDLKDKLSGFSSDTAGGLEEARALEQLGGAGTFVSPGPYGGYDLGFASGGFVPGTGNRDSVHAMLTPGEFVVKKDGSNIGDLAAAGGDTFNIYTMNPEESAAAVVRAKRTAAWLAA